MIADTIESNDIEDLLDDYMEQNFNTNCQEIEDHKEIGDILIKIRQELTECAHNDTDMMLSPELKKLVEFNVTNRSNLEGINKMA